MVINEKTYASKVEEYLYLLKRCYPTIPDDKLSTFRKILLSYKLEVSLEKREYGDAHVITDLSKIILYKYPIEKKCATKGDYFFDEVIFHEFSHMINSFHSSFSGPKQFMICDAISARFNNSTTPDQLEKQDAFLYNQDPCFGTVLIDEFIAQSIAQKLVIEKFCNSKMFFAGQQEKYFANSSGPNYYDHKYVTNICEPPMQINTSFDDYPEFYPLAKLFIYDLGYNLDDFVANSLDENFFKKIISSVQGKQAEKLYKDLCYLGIIQQRVYYNSGFINLDDHRDPAYDPKKVNTVMQRLLKK